MILFKVSLAGSRMAYTKAFLFQILIEVWIGKGGIAPKVAVDFLAAITGDNRFEYGLPVLGTMHIAFAQ